MNEATWIIDGIAMGFLKYIFCIVAAVIIHDDKYTYETFQDSIGIGISLQCSSTLFTCLITAYKSEVKINIVLIQRNREPQLGLLNNWIVP